MNRGVRYQEYDIRMSFSGLCDLIVALESLCMVTNGLQILRSLDRKVYNNKKDHREENSGHEEGSEQDYPGIAQGKLAKVVVFTGNNEEIGHLRS